MTTEEQDFYNYCINYYSIYDKMVELKNELDRLNPHIQNMLDKGYSHIIDKVVSDIQKGNVQCPSG